MIGKIETSASQIPESSEISFGILSSAQVFMSHCSQLICTSSSWIQLDGLSGRCDRPVIVASGQQKPRLLDLRDSNTLGFRVL